MSYFVDERLPKDYFKSVMEEKAEMLRKYLRNIGDPLVFSTDFRHNMAAFKFYSHKEEDSLKLHFTFSSLGDLQEQLYFLWVQLNYVIKGSNYYHQLMHHIKVK